MKLVLRGRPQLRQSRRARFEQLEPRHLLAAANVALTANADVQQMPSVAVDPMHPNHVVVAYMDYSLFDKTDDPTTPNVNESYDHPYAGIGITESSDSGDHWQYSSIPLPQGFLADKDHATGLAAPTIKFDNVDHDGDPTNGVQNRVYVVFMAVEFLSDKKPPLTNPTGPELRSLGFQANNGIFVSYSDDGGIVWQTPTSASPRIDAKTGIQTAGPNKYDGKTEVPFEINPDLAIDPNSGRVYVTWARYYPSGQFPGEDESGGGSQDMISVSEDGGVSWTTQLAYKLDSETYETVIVDNYDSGAANPGAGAANNPHVAVGPNGDVYVSIFERNVFFFYHSSDGGESFVRPDTDTLRGLPFGAGATSPTPPGIPLLDFRLLVQRGTVADPTRPGTVYVADAWDLQPTDTVYDVGDIVFARSTDNGETWESSFGLGSNHDAVVLNDDNNGDRARVDDLRDDLTNAQVMPRLAVDEDGNIALIWYDTRRDPTNHRMDVFATVSVDGGHTFSPNFRVTDESFDTDLGRFTDATGAESAYFGDAIGLALANRTMNDGHSERVMYAAWTGTDTRKGNQDIFFRRVSLDSHPDAPTDRFEPNETAVTATQIGPVINQRLPRLNLVEGDNDWFQFKSLATGTISISALSDEAQALQLKLIDTASGEVSGSQTELRDAQGHLIGIQFTAAGKANHTYQLQVFSTYGGGSAGTEIIYKLDIQSVTGDLGQIVYRKVNGTLAEKDHDYYLVQSAAAGVIEGRVNLSPGFDGEATVEFLDPLTYDVLASAHGADLHVQSPVDKGQSLIVHVTGGSGSFQLELTNLDQFNLSKEDQGSLFFPAGQGPANAAIADFNRDGYRDVAVSSTSSNVVNVLIGNGDGTFQAPRQFDVGAYTPVKGKPPQIGRAVAAVDVNVDGWIDLIVTNYASADVSVLLGRGDGTFEPQRRFNASAAPFGMAVGDFNGDGLPDAAVVDSTSKHQGEIAILLGQMNGPIWSFEPPRFLASALSDDFPLARIKVADLDKDEHDDLIVASDFDPQTHVFFGIGNGNFHPATDYKGSGSSLAVFDLNGDTYPDILKAQYVDFKKVGFILNKGNGTFEKQQQFVVGASPLAVAVTDWNDDTIPDLIVANSGLTQPLISGPPTVMLLRGKADDTGQFVGFDDGTHPDDEGPVILATVDFPHDLQIDYINADDAPDIVVTGLDGIEVIFGQPPTIVRNDSRATARDLGTVVHDLQPTLTITPEHSDAFYKLTVPAEAFSGAGDQVLDFSGGFTNQSRDDALVMEVTDDNGNVLASGGRFRVVVPQNNILYIHIFGDGPVETGTGAYTLDINTLPQVSAVEAHNLLPGIGGQPGGPTTSIVLVLQGDRLVPTSAEDPSNYTVTWLGPNGVTGGGDDQPIPVGAGLIAGSQPVVYSPGSNVDVSSGRALTYPTAVRQTVTLLFANALPAGNYEIIVDSKVVSTAFNSDENGLVTRRDGFSIHPVVSVVDSAVVEKTALPPQINLVKPAGALGDLSAFEDGTSFLSQFHDDLAALLDTLLANIGNDPTITDQLIKQIVAGIGAALGPAGSPIIPLLVFFLDPPSSGVVDPTGLASSHSLQTNTLNTNLRRAFVGVGSNIDLIVFANPNGEYRLNLADVPPNARGGVVYFGPQNIEAHSLTEKIRGGQRSFSFQFGADTVSQTFFGGFLGVSHLIGSPASQPLITGDRANTNGLNGAAALTNELTLLLANSAAAVTSPTNDFGDSGGAALRQWHETVQDALADLGNLWDEFDRKFLGKSETDNVDAKAAVSKQSAGLRVWSTAMSVWNDLFGGKETSQTPPAHQDRPANNEKAAAAKAEPEVTHQSDSTSATHNQSSAEGQSATSTQPNLVVPPTSSTDATDTATSSGHASSSERGSESHVTAA